MYNKPISTSSRIAVSWWRTPQRTLVSDAQIITWSLLCVMRYDAMMGVLHNSTAGTSHSPTAYH